jgi:hypothetical protein
VHGQAVDVGDATGPDAWWQRGVSVRRKIREIDASLASATRADLKVRLNVACFDGRARCERDSPDRGGRRRREELASRNIRPLRAHVRFRAGTCTPAIFSVTLFNEDLVVKYSVFQSSPPKATFVVAGMPCTMRPSFLPV